MSPFFKKVTRSARNAGRTICSLFRGKCKDNVFASEWPEHFATRSYRTEVSILEAREREIELAKAEIEERERIVRFEIIRVEACERAANRVFASAEAYKKSIDRVTLRLKERKEELTRAHEAIKRYEDSAMRIETDIKEREIMVSEREVAVRKREEAVGMGEYAVANREAVNQAILLGEELRAFLAATALPPSGVATATETVKMLEYAVEKTESSEADDAAEDLGYIGQSIILGKRLLEILKVLNYAQYIAHILNKCKKTATTVDAAIATEALRCLGHTFTLVNTQLEAVVSEPAIVDKAIRYLEFDISHAKGCLDMISTACHR
ncbi:hypothetical protein GGF41_003349 [Coemansia sp. RSA 2531]|nr:hypothetical protein GGF41_003349 [Coemansia sp. RSA 2531]